MSLPSNPSLPNPHDDIHGWSADKVQARQRQTAEALNESVVFRHKPFTVTVTQKKLFGRLGEASGTLTVMPPEMVIIPAGSFLMGSPEYEEARDADERQHRVMIEKPFAMGKYAVTFAEYDAFCAATNREKLNDRSWGRGHRPVIDVSWHEAVAYCDWLSQQTGAMYRLPTEAEWEYACRAGTTTAFWWGNRMDTQQANYDGNYTYGGGPKGVSREKTVPVDEFQPNPWGLYQMHGNVWEWTCSAYDKSYNGAELRCARENADTRCVVRGGGWYYNPLHLRAANRRHVALDERNVRVGFRLAMTF